MTKVAIIILTAADTPEGRGRMIHAMTAAQELKEAGTEVKILFEGIGVTWLTAFHKQEEPFTQNYAPVFEAIKEDILGACNFCATGRFDAGEAAQALGIGLVGADGEHYSLGNLIAEGYQAISF